MPNGMLNADPVGAAKRQIGWSNVGRTWPVNERLTLVALFLLGLAPRLWESGERSFWLDELGALGIAARDFNGVRQALTAEANMTLYYWALHFWLRLVGFGA